MSGTENAGASNTRRLAILAGGGLLLLAIGMLVPTGNNPTPKIVGAAGRPASQGPGQTGGASPGGAAQVRLMPEQPMRDLFTPTIAIRPPAPARAAAPPLPAAPPPAPAAPPAGREEPAAPAASPELPPAAEMRMLGVVAADGKTQVLLRNAVSGQSRYLEQGAEAWGFRVEKIEAEAVLLARGTETHRVEMTREISIEGPGSNSSSGSSGFTAAGGGGTRGDRRASPSGGFDQSVIFSLPTWAERLKKLEEVKSQLEPDRYERFKRFFEARAAAEKGR